MREPYEVLLLTPRPGPDVRTQWPVTGPVHTTLERTSILPTLLINQLRDNVRTGEETPPPAVTVYRASGAIVLDTLVDELFASPEAAAVRAAAATETTSASGEQHRAQGECYADVAETWQARLAAALDPSRATTGS